MRPQVELGQVKAEDLDLSTHVGKTSVCDARAAMRAKAAIDEVELLAQLLDRDRVVSEPLPDRAQPPPIGLVVVLPEWDLHHLAHHWVRLDERRRHAPGARELANVATEQLARKRACALERDLDGVGTGVWIAVEVSADPGSESGHGSGLRRAPPQLAEKIRGRLPERLLEVP